MEKKQKEDSIKAGAKQALGLLGTCLGSLCSEVADLAQRLDAAEKTIAELRAEKKQLSEGVKCSE